MQIPAVSMRTAASAVTPSSGGVGAARKGKTFVRTLTEAVAQVNKMQLDSAQSGKQLAMGSADSIHKVVLEAEEASLSMQMVVSLRNKAMDAYQEVMRMQV